MDQSTQVVEHESGRLRRRIDRFRRAGLLEHVDTITVEQAVTADELIEAYSLVHDVFVHQNYIAPQPGGMRLRPFEALPAMATFVAKAGGRVVAVMSVVPDDPDLGLPSDKAFKPELDELRRQGRRLCETTNLAVADEYRNSPAFFELIRCCIAHGLNSGYDDSFISISPGHAMFFQAVLGFEACGDRRNYGDSVVDMVEGMRLNLRTFESGMLRADVALGHEAFLHDWFFAQNPHYVYTKASAMIAAQKFMDPGFLRRIFAHPEELSLKWGKNALEAVHRRWGDFFFSQVFEHVQVAAAGCRSLAA